jgi:multidrug resistance efflux pump
MGMRGFFKIILTGAVVLAAAYVFFQKYEDYVHNPWTRDGQVRANVIQITPRVSGPILSLPIKDNQLVKTGDLLFEIDPRTYEATLEQAWGELDNVRQQVLALEKEVEVAKAAVKVAEADVEQAAFQINIYEAEIEKTDAELKRQEGLLPQGATSQKTVDRARANYRVNVEKKKSAQSAYLEAESSLIKVEADLDHAKATLGIPGEANARVHVAKAKVRQAELDLEFTRVRAPVTGYVTNLNLRTGSQAVSNQPALALVDINSYWVHGFFRETTIADIVEGDRAIVTLMTYPDDPLEGVVDSLGWGIAQDDGSTGQDLLPSINPTFEWIRLAQRVPVRIHLTNVPDGIHLRVGTTASVLVLTGDTTSNERQSE